MRKAMESPLKISQLVALVAVAEQGGFSAAALHLGLAQSTVSHAIASLESDLGVVLLIRNHTGAALTPIGTQIVQQAQGILTQLQALRHTANQAKGLQKGRVRVAAVRTVATHILPSVISQFRQVHPQLTVEISEYDIYTEIEKSLKEGESDIGFTLLPTPAGFQSWELFREDFVALLPPIPAKELDEPLNWETLVGYSRIVNSRSAKHNNLVTNHIASFGYSSPIAYEVREDSTLMSMVKKGLGAAVLA